MGGRDDQFRRTLLEQATQPFTPETVETLAAFNYSIAFNPEAQQFYLFADQLNTKRRLSLPFGRLEFGTFVKDMTKALERVQNMEENASPNGE